MIEKIVDTKENVMKFLKNSLDYYIYQEPNPFIESRMVSYISNGIKKLEGLGVKGKDIITMFDVNDILDFEIGGNNGKN